MKMTRKGLHRTLSDLHSSLRAGVGLPTITYRDEWDSFVLTISRSNRGYSVNCRLNNQQTYQLNGLLYQGGTPIGEVMLLAASAPDNATIDEFFKGDAA